MADRRSTRRTDDNADTSDDVPAPPPVAEASGRVVIVHKDLPGVERSVTAAQARVFAKAGWTAK